MSVAILVEGEPLVYRPDLCADHLQMFMFRLGNVFGSMLLEEKSEN